MEGSDRFDVDQLFDEFRDHVRFGLVTGWEAQGKQATYIPLPKLREYWTYSRVSQIVHATDCRVPIEDIRKHYLQAFSILVWISKTGQPYVRYLNIFSQHGRGDTCLPHQERPNFLSSADDANEFWAAFDTHQWEFCPVVLGSGMLHDRRLHSKQILPLQIEHRLGHAKSGKPAKVERAKLQSPVELGLSNSAHVVLKSYLSRDKEVYDREVKAFTAFRNAPTCENILGYLGSYGTVTEGNMNYTIILEYADRGTLLDVFHRNRPPVTFEEIKIFWSRIYKIVKALYSIQNTLPKTLGSSCVHQDIKPSNIFACGDEEGRSEDYRSTLKIGDFGESSVVRADPLHRTSRGFDNRGGRTYCPPELHWNDDVDLFVGPLVDVWAIGCVIIEAAIWVTFGEPKRVAFQQERREENKQVAPTQRGLGRSDCFHNGKGRLNVVNEVHRLILTHGRRCDSLTPDIVQLILNHVLVDESARYGSRLLTAELNNMIDTATETVYDLSGRGSTASSADLSQRSRERRSSNGNDYHELHRSSLSTFRVGELDRHIERNSTQIFAVDDNGDPRAAPWNPQNSGQNPLERNTLPLRVLSSLPKTEDTPQARPQYNTSIGMDDAPGPSQSHGIGSRQAPDSSISQVIKGSSPDDFRSPAAHILHHPKGQLDVPTPPQADVNERRNEEKEKKYRRPLRGEDEAMSLLQKRDHVFLIDNSRSMLPFEKQVIDTFANLAHILEKADDDGLDVMCTSQSGRFEHDRRTERLVSFVQSSFQKGTRDRCFIEASLHFLISKVIQDLPSGAGAWPKRGRGFMGLIGKKYKGRPISIYVLTNGVWDSPQSTSMCGADGPIRQLIKELKKRNLHRNQVSIQFIRFGNDETGIKRLTYLDDELKKETGFDIVDHKVSTSGVWPMLVGSLDEGTDLWEGTSEGAPEEHGN
ncbi:hypothetical protein VPNG_01208 [Cytospora leucostoma]|uniref:non-specific serine/threonine protein kinase n=1 Tax=Cytospora leucostoma TaxID=1230097 RepID=A0A423XL42_9PEZI|nr:hypothetical protein VPNG_01208 [Cytospora leucostoma]